ncbi:unnamed protein product [Cuscuta campestris]|uniref:Uncharacterized protein n=1 Tax=Cuscuta campestris TaxID=132261 RepID=A0A484KL15_9ASTE|nr:unnamed protein product [Cuscuta campestris]
MWRWGKPKCCNGCFLIILIRSFASYVFVGVDGFLAELGAGGNTSTISAMVVEVIEDLKLMEKKLMFTCSLKELLGNSMMCLEGEFSRGQLWSIQPKALS